MIFYNITCDFLLNKFPGLFHPLNINQGGEKGKRMDEGAEGVTNLSAVISVMDENVSALLLDPEKE